ncbi:tripartite tricarboxylate transporter substrate binding protein [Ramlibacter sp.]|uniref:Bug family tripartite tricarboxylate transporter substrate binding protein n=1 Tax=Ramlibacter sp. TaxID=1917967 RepID=UPI002612E04E|nr:tripartite tricarboxylate transporter substrate binding protein [Ramlibacter sp.]MDB5953830.1 Tripartite-type tricarboxylate transporter, receptor component TctC [Ramlibacter sp.]
MTLSPFAGRRQLLLAATLAACAPLSALAQADYPSRPITIVVPFPAGGPTDASARLYASVMGEILGQSVIIDNRAGAAGTVGSAAVARATPDGYTLLWGGTSTLAVAPGLYKNLHYDAQSFVPIGMALRGPLMIAAHPGAGVATLQDLVKAKGRKLNVGTAGNGSIGHLATELLVETSGAQLTHVPYRGGGPALTDVLGGQVELIFDNASQLYPYVKSGKLRALAVTGAQPYAPGPEVPTVKSVLGKDYEAYSWFGLVAPKGTPEPAVQKLMAAMTKAAQSPQIRRELEQQGLEPGVPAREFGAVIAADYKKWSGIINRAHVTVE